MTNDVELVPREVTLALRELHRKEMDCQIILDSWHGRGWVDSYLLRIDGRVAGYGLVGGVRDEPRETVTEFHVLSAHRGRSLPCSAGSWRPAAPGRSRSSRTIPSSRSCCTTAPR